MNSNYPKVETRTFYRNGTNGFEVSVNCNTIIRIEREGVWYDVEVNKNHVGRYIPNADTPQLLWMANLVAEAVNLFHSEVHRVRVLYKVTNETLSYVDTFGESHTKISNNQKSERQELIDIDPMLAKSH